MSEGTFSDVADHSSSSRVQGSLTTIPGIPSDHTCLCNVESSFPPSLCALEDLNTFLKKKKKTKKKKKKTELTRSQLYCSN